ncbi:hypothetical protein NDU88_002337 [Pleurodeles waltl]|uniref:Uncharacterized protein n=1 Tax=Pleurodeles waltl TaxID=8319 RepID=A0AAV7TKW8_PLEWA|nr:hypothetical protein NDU88_002337 [Pleurodeles waltl]
MSPLLAYFKKKPKLEFKANGGDIKPTSGHGEALESVVTDALSAAFGSLTTAVLIYRPASPDIFVKSQCSSFSPEAGASAFSQSASHEEVSHSPLQEGQPTATLSMHELSPIIISSDHSVDVREWVTSLAASPAASYLQDGQVVSCQDHLEDCSIAPLTSPLAAQWTRPTGSVRPMLPTRSCSGAGDSSSQIEFNKGADLVAQYPLSKREKKGFGNNGTKGRAYPKDPQTMLSCWFNLRYSSRCSRRRSPMRLR